MKKLIILLFTTVFIFAVLNITVSADDVAYVTSNGVRITLHELYDIRDFFIAKGEFNTYSEIKSNGFIFRATAAKLGDQHEYSYTVPQPGMHTILIRYNDGTQKIFHEDLCVEKPTFTTNGLQITVGNIPDVKVIRTAYGEYNTPGEVKRAEGARSFSGKSVIKGAQSYKIQYRNEGFVTVAIQYNNGYSEVFHHNIQKKTPTVKQESNCITFGNLDGLVLIRYAKGEYASSADIKAAGGKVIKPDAVSNGKITVSDLENGIYTFSVQYDDESYNYYTVNIEALPGRIVCWGDSLTHGIMSGWEDLAEYPYPRRLSQMTDMEVKNYGIGAEAAEIIAMRQGGLPTIVKPFTIPAGTTPVQIEVVGDFYDTPTLFDYYGDAAINPITIGGVEGTLTRSGNGYYFTRLKAGEGVELKGYTKAYTYAMLDKRENDIIVIWSGHNNDYTATEGYKLVDTIDKMIKYHGNDRYIIIGMTAERRAPAYKEVNAELAEKYGERFIDAQPYLADPARLTELGITPTAKDNEYLAKGWTPPSLLAADNLHLNQAGYDIIAELVYEKILELGYPMYKMDTSEKEYTITFDAGEGTTFEYQANTGDNYCDVITKLPKPTRQNYRFMGWANSYGYYLDMPEYVHDCFVYREDITFTAVWQEEVTYAINFDPLGGTMDEGCYTSYPIHHGDHYYEAIPKYPTATKDGYTFGGWYIAEYNYTLTPSSFYYDYYAIYKDCTFTAIWEKK